MACPICKKEHAYSVPQALSSLALTSKRLARLVATLGPAKARRRPMPDKWSAKEIINHLADGEIVYGFRYRKILAEPGTPLVAFDQDRWADGLLYRELPLKTSLESFAALRNHNLAVLKAQRPEAWDRAGAHPEYGTLSLRQLVLHLVDHDRNHTAQVERLAAAAKPAKKTTRKRARR